MMTFGAIFAAAIISMPPRLDDENDESREDDDDEDSDDDAPYGSARTSPPLLRRLSTDRYAGIAAYRGAAGEYDHTVHATKKRTARLVCRTVLLCQLLLDRPVIGPGNFPGRVPNQEENLSARSAR